MSYSEVFHSLQLYLHILENHYKCNIVYIYFIFTKLTTYLYLYLHCLYSLKRKANPVFMVLALPFTTLSTLATNSVSFSLILVHSGGLLLMPYPSVSIFIKSSLFILIVCLKPSQSSILHPFTYPIIYIHAKPLIHTVITVSISS